MFSLNTARRISVLLLFFLYSLGLVIAWTGEPGLKAGFKAPDFRVLTSDGKSVTLSDYYKKRPVVLIFYSGGWCPFCNSYLHTWQRHLADFRKTGITIWAISTDKPEYTEEIVKQEGFGFDLISDPQARILKTYNVQNEVPESLARQYIQHYHIEARVYRDRKRFVIAIPAEYVIDKSGKIIYAKADFKIRAKPEEILELLKRKERKGA